MKLWPLMVLCVLVAMACSKVNSENYAQLRVGMTYEEVVSILGKTDDCDAVLGARSCVWKSGKKQIKVQMVGNKVILFSAQGI
ncbi:MAG: DUF3862 domain-containing protein [Desulfatitalea sp.]|nr:DUF3862 domain-containing protein [Desulfatitalea sp.]